MAETQRTTGELARAVEALLSERTGGEVKVRELVPLFGGACQDNYKLELSISRGELQGDRRMVLRSDAVQSLPSSLNRQDEFHVIRAAVRAGVRTPDAHWLCEGLVRPGAGAYFMDWVEGEALGRRVVKHPELAAAREKLPEELAAELAKVHTVTRASAPELGLDRAPTRQGAAAAALAHARALSQAMREPHPAVELALRWLSDHVPAGEEETLVHGDFRTGNFMVTPAGLSAVLDWEFARFGDPMEDVGWLCVRDWRFGQNQLPAGGLATRPRFYDAYARASGRAVLPAKVHWWEVMGNVRWAVGSVGQGERYLSGEESDLELIAIARRAVEMEYEALRLIEKGA
ncbi:MAG TPA: phosphotransferase family protein [Myxococcales bacterium]|jgi:aminoglycoside phosphotransferase (APT) family kinase protein|nr:phosphotransferase family protein [Myxococcales bacterium]